jgi:hypothetical protein
MASHAEQAMATKVQGCAAGSPSAYHHAIRGHRHLLDHQRRRLPFLVFAGVRRTPAPPLSLSMNSTPRRRRAPG